MPDGFAFPDESQWWTPLRLRVGDYEPGQGPSIQVFGWLTDGASLDDVRRELIPLANNAAARFPDTHGHLRPEVQPFGTIFMGVSELGVHSLSTLFFLALLTLISANIALLVFARTAMRESEIIVRTALGASRRRIVMQLFAEALVLGIVAAVVGLMAANTGLNWVIETMEHVGIGLPYWFHRRLTPAAVLYAGVFTVVAAVVIGVIPALKATGRRSQSRLQHVGARGSTLQMGGVWTAVVVIQVAFTVFAGRVAIELGLDTNEIRTTDLMFAADEFVSARVAMDPLPPSGSPEDTSRTAFAAAFQAAYTELGRAVAAQPGVRGVTFADQDPGAFHPRGSIDIEDVPVPDGTSVHRAQMAAVDLSFFEAVGAPIVAGRSFSLADGDAQVVIVNESFVRDILDGRNAVGRHLRYRNPDRPSWPASTDQVPGPWLEIVGVVRDVAMTVDPDLPHGAGIYHLLSPGAPAGARWHAGEPVRMAVHVAGNPAEFASTLGSVVASVDPALEIDDVRTMDRAAESLLRTYDAWFRVVVLTGALAMILSNTGIYAVMSFAVSRRTREIGVRVALGATATRIVTAIFSRSLAQVALGVLVGGVLLVALGAVRTTPRSMALFGTYIAVMMIVCLLSCIVPTRRALTIEPTEALKE
jgi:predicted permease